MAFGSQEVAQSPQNVHSPFEKSTSGIPRSPATMIASGQAETQSMQLIQEERKILSGCAHGGRKGDFQPRKAFLRNSDLDNVAVIMNAHRNT